MGDIKKTLSTFRALLSKDGATAHFLYLPGPPPHIEFDRSKPGSNEAGAAIGMATRQGDTVYLVPKAAKDLKEKAVKELNKALKSKMNGVVFELGGDDDGSSDDDTSDDDADRDDKVPGKAAAQSSDGGNRQVAALMAKIMASSGALLARTDLPPQLTQVQAALKKAAATSRGDAKQLATAFQKLRSAAMTFDAERDAAQNASTSDYGNIPQGQGGDDNALPPLPPTPDEENYGNIPQGQPPLPPTPGAADSDYGDLLVGEGDSKTGYDGTYQDLDLVPKPDDAENDNNDNNNNNDNNAPAAAHAAPGDPYGQVDAGAMEAFRLAKIQEIEDLEDQFRDTIEATFNKLHDRLEGTEYAPGSKKHRNVLRGMARFAEIAEGPEPDARHLIHIMRELRLEIVAAIKAIKAKSAT